MLLEQPCSRPIAGVAGNALLTAYDDVRRLTVRLCAPLSADVWWLTRSTGHLGRAGDAPVPVINRLGRPSDSVACT